MGRLQRFTYSRFRPIQLISLCAQSGLQLQGAGGRGEGLGKIAGLQHRLSASGGVGLYGLVGAGSSFGIITGEKNEAGHGFSFDGFGVCGGCTC
jgi:hypothetical protein